MPAVSTVSVSVRTVYHGLTENFLGATIDPVVLFPEAAMRSEKSRTTSLENSDPQDMYNRVDH